ncbi:hypothetical protein Hanom_Chr09g00846251 [Helianthus anomalus]
MCGCRSSGHPPNHRPSTSLRHHTTKPPQLPSHVNKSFSFLITGEHNFSDNYLSLHLRQLSLNPPGN